MLVPLGDRLDRRRLMAVQLLALVAALYLLFYAVGSGLGAIGTTAMGAHAGWQGVCLLGAAVSLFALVFWAATRRAMPAPSSGE